MRFSAALKIVPLGNERQCLQLIRTQGSSYVSWNPGARFALRPFFSRVRVLRRSFLFPRLTPCSPWKSSLEINPSAFAATQERRFDDLDDTSAFICSHWSGRAILDARADGFVKPSPAAAFGCDELAVPTRL